MAYGKFNLAKSKKCRQCGDAFCPTSNRQMECGDQCYIKARSRPNEAGCWMWQGAVMNSGYGSANIPAHQRSYMAFHGDIPAGMFVCHRCDVKLCCNPEHLFLGTNFDNMQDCARKGRNSRKLTDEQVLAIRAAPKTIGHATLGRQCGVSEVMVAKIRRGEWWKHLLPTDENKVVKTAQIT